MYNKKIVFMLIINNFHRLIMFPTEECQLKWDIIIITTGNAAWRDAVQEGN